MIVTKLTQHNLLTLNPSLACFVRLFCCLPTENILFDAAGNVVLTDFGLSKENVPDNYTARSFVGTPEYLAPEVVTRAGHGKAADFYSLGVVLYELLTGQPPFYHQNPERLYHKVSI